MIPTCDREKSMMIIQSISWWLLSLIPTSIWHMHEWAASQAMVMCWKSQWHEKRSRFKKNRTPSALSQKSIDVKTGERTCLYNATDSMYSIYIHLRMMYLIVLLPFQRSPKDSYREAFDREPCWVSAIHRMSYTKPWHSFSFKVQVCSQNLREREREREKKENMLTQLSM